MKAKLKSPEVAKEKGADYVKKCVKKRLTESFEEGAVQFLYDAEFDYGKENGGVAPLLFVGDLSSEWRKYLKENKTKASIAAGRCLPNPEDTFLLNMEVKLGKGGKAKFLKLVNKDLLKPFAKGQFVDSIESGKALGDDADLQDVAPSDDSDLVADATGAELLKEAQELWNSLVIAQSTMQGIVGALLGPLKDLGKTIVTDALIDQGNSALISMEQTDLAALLPGADAWLKGDAKNEIAKNKDLSDLYTKILGATKELVSLKPSLKTIEEGILKLEKVSGSDAPGSASAPVSDKPIKNFESMILGIGNQFAFTAAIGQILKSINK